MQALTLSGGSGGGCFLCERKRIPLWMCAAGAQSAAFVSAIRDSLVARPQGRHVTAFPKTQAQRPVMAAATATAAAPAFGMPTRETWLAVLPPDDVRAALDVIREKYDQTFLKGTVAHVSIFNAFVPRQQVGAERACVRAHAHAQRVSVMRHLGQYS